MSLSKLRIRQLPLVSTQSQKAASLTQQAKTAKQERQARPPCAPELATQAHVHASSAVRIVLACELEAAAVSEYQSFYCRSLTCATRCLSRQSAVAAVSAAAWLQPADSTLVYAGKPPCSGVLAGRGCARGAACRKWAARWLNGLPSSGRGHISQARCAKLTPACSQGGHCVQGRGLDMGALARQRARSGEQGGRGGCVS